MESEGPYKSERWECQNEFVITGPGWEFVGGTYTKNEADLASRFANLAYAEGRKSMEKEIEEKKAIKDTLLCGTGFVMEGKRVPPEDVYLSETEIKLQKVEKEFKELLSIAQELCDDLGDDIAEKFRDWKKARGIE
jgi:hypothetical protein